MRKTPWELSKEDVGWLAGILDGEGSIHLKYYETYPHFRYGIYLVNTNIELLEKALRIIKELDTIDKGEGISVYKKMYANANRKVFPVKQCYQVQIRRIGTIKEMLRAILPHLTEKKERATLLLKELDNHKRNARWKKDKPVETKRVTPE